MAESELLHSADSSAKKRGTHKLFLGFAAGVGKTYAMLDEAHRRKSRGQDIVVGLVETHGRKTTAEHIADLEVIPRKQVEYRGTTLEEMDTEAIIQRKPLVVLVDELAHTNVPGSTREKRWQDVDAILDAGINVLSTMNVQHLESLNDHVSDITGVRVRETVPDYVLRTADEVEVVDVTPRALINRLERGDIYPAEKIQQARANWFREGNLSALRELALREAAGRVDEDVEEYRRERKIERPWAVNDRVMICISPSRSSMRLLRRGWRMAQRMHADALAVLVEEREPSEAARRILEEDSKLAERLHIPVVQLKGNPAEQIIKFAREKNITHLVVGHSNRSGLQQRLKSSIVTEIIRELKTIDILVVAEEQAPG
jgi:two-component system sensor histidine kinase KdpD